MPVQSTWSNCTTITCTEPHIYIHTMHWHNYNNYIYICTEIYVLILRKSIVNCTCTYLYSWYMLCLNMSLWFNPLVMLRKKSFLLLLVFLQWTHFWLSWWYNEQYRLHSIQLHLLVGEELVFLCLTVCLLAVVLSDCAYFSSELSEAFWGVSFTKERGC